MSINVAGLPAPEAGKLHTMGIRGAVPIALGPSPALKIKTTAGMTRFLVFGQELECFLGTCDPGKWYGQHPINPKGTAHLVEGGPYSYAKGKHKGHSAVVEDGPVKIWRMLIRT